MSTQTCIQMFVGASRTIATNLEQPSIHQRLPLKQERSKQTAPSTPDGSVLRNIKETSTGLMYHQK